MDVQECFQAGQLDEAVQAAVESVKKKPTDVGLRVLLAELLCFTGDLERAEKQLDVALMQDPETAMNLSLIRQLVRAEQARQDFFTKGHVPEFLDLPSELMKLHLQASIAFREGNMEEAHQLLAQSEEQRPTISGTCDGEEFTDVRDLDDMTSSFFETLTSTGKYYWIPMDRIELMEFHPPETPRDLLWRRCRMVVNGGPDGEVFLPTIYPGTVTDGDNALKLGRATDWKGSDGEPVRGIGQRTFLFGENDQTIMQIGEITFAGSVGPQDSPED